MLIEKHKHLAKASKNNKLLAAATTAAKQHDHVSVFFAKLLMTFRYNFHQSQSHRYSSYYSAFMGILGVISLSQLPLCCVDAVGYSYTRFIGPVAGPEHRIYVNDAGNAHSGSHASRLDYVAKPEYEFAYGVEDAEAHILHNRNEMRDGDDVKGVYSVVDPDGTLRVVKYTADETNGFQAEVITNGVSSLHGGQQHFGTPNNNNNNNYQPQLNGGFNRPSIAYTPNLEEHIKHYYPQNLYPTPSPTPIIYQYNNDNYYNNNNNNNDDVDNGNGNGNGNDYNDNYRPQYEVHEKQNDKDHKENNNDDSGKQYDDDYNNDDNDDGNKKKTNPTTNNDNKKKKGHNDNSNDDNDDDDDHNDNSDDDYDDSEELDDYDEVARSNEASEENDEYY